MMITVWYSTLPCQGACRPVLDQVEGTTNRRWIQIFCVSWTPFPRPQGTPLLRSGRHRSDRDRELRRHCAGEASLLLRASLPLPFPTHTLRGGLAFCLTKWKRRERGERHT